MSPPGVSRVLRSLCAGALVAAPVALWLTPAAAAKEFTGVASAAAVRTTYSIAQNPLGIFEASGPFATAVTSSLPSSSAFASYPFPGYDGIATINLVRGAAAPDAPAYPTAVSANTPGTPSQEIEQPGYQLLAKTGVGQATARGSSGGSSGEGGDESRVGVNRAESVVTGDLTTGAVTATATAVVDGLAAGPLVMGRVSAMAKAERNASGTLKRSARLDIGQATVSGVGVDVTEKGLVLAGTATPLPDGLAEGLTAAGVSIEYVRPRDIPDGVVSPGVKVTVVSESQDLPNGDPTGRQVVTTTLGEAQAVASQEAGFGDGGTGGSGSTTTGTAGGTTGAGSGSAGGGSGGSTGGPFTPPPGSGSATGTGTDGSAGQPPAVAPGGGSGDPTRAVGRVAETVGSGRFYAVLVVAALAAFGLGQLMRFMGVRWASSSG